MLSDENKLRIFSGNANPDLAREIAAYLGHYCWRCRYQPL